MREWVTGVEHVENYVRGGKDGTKMRQVRVHQCGYLFLFDFKSQGLLLALGRRGRRSASDQGHRRDAAETCFILRARAVGIYRLSSSRSRSLGFRRLLGFLASSLLLVLLNSENERKWRKKWV
jgi:hypothetical protein